MQAIIDLQHNFLYPLLARCTVSRLRFKLKTKTINGLNNINQYKAIINTNKHILLINLNLKNYVALQ